MNGIQANSPAYAIKVMKQECNMSITSMERLGGKKVCKEVCSKAYN